MNLSIQKIFLIVSALFLAACTPSNESNVLGYLVAKQIHQTFAPDGVGSGRECRSADAPVGSIRGTVLHGTFPVKSATVLVAERCGRPHSATSDEDGHYRIDNVPVGQYVVAAVAPDFDEAAIHGDWGTPTLVLVHEDETVEAPPLRLAKHQIRPLEPIDTFELMETVRYTSTAPFPAGSSAQVTVFQFQHDGTTIDTLRLYLPNNEATADEASLDKWPLLFMVYPTPVGLWESVSVAFASQGFALVAISPHASRGDRCRCPCRGRPHCVGVGSIWSAQPADRWLTDGCARWQL